MDVKEALELAEQLVCRTLKPLEILIFEESWKSRKGRKYSEIADDYGCEVGTVNDAASDLWKLLSDVLGEKVSRNTLQGVLEKRWRSHSAVVPQTQEQAQKETPSKNTDFVGREEAIAHLNTLIASRNAKIIGIYGKGGIGKTKLAEQYFEQYLEAKGFKTLRLNVGTEAQSITRVEGWIEDRLRLDFKEKLGQKFDLMRLLDRLRRHLQTQQLAILIDNLEPALDENGKFIALGYVQLIRVLAEPNVKSITLITSRERPNESKVTIEPYPLPELDENAWREFFSKFEINAHTPDLSAMHQAYGGNALAMKVLCYPIQTNYDGDLEAYWQDHKDFLLKGEIKDLISSQFDRLQELNIKAYKLLCRLGLYRYQQIIPKVPLAVLLSLLWDVVEEERIQIIESLERRNLVESHKREYWLHPVIQTEARARLNTIEELNDDLLFLMKKQIDALLDSEPKFQHFLAWVSKKSSSVQTPYKLGAVRAFYFTLMGFPAVDLNLAPALDSSFGCDLNHSPSLMPVSDLSFAPALANAGASELALDLNLMVAYYYAAYGDEIEEDSFSNNFDLYETLRKDTFSIDFNLYDALEYANAHQCEWQQSLQQLRQQLPDPDYDEEEEFYAWWVDESPTWSEQLGALIIEYRKIELDWQLRFSPEDWQVLLQYYDANRLLVDCLNNASNVSLEMRSQIEDTLLLPIAEIEKRRLGD